MDACSLKLIGELMIQVSFFILVCIDHDAKPKDFFTQGLWGGLPQRTSSTPLMEYLKDSLETGQIEDGFFNFKSIKGHTKRGGLSLTLTNQGPTALNVTPTGYPMKLLCLFGMVVPTAHTTQQKFVIGQFLT